MKTLYSILGVAVDATPAQIEQAYAALLLSLGEGGGEDQRIRLIAVKEAYAVLSDADKRQLYNHKLFVPETANLGARGRRAQEETASFFSTGKIVLIGALVLAGIALYSYNAREREKLRIQHEHEVQMKATQILEDSHLQSAAVQNAQLERQERLDAMSKERQERADLERFNREVEQRRLQNERSEQLAAQQKAQRERADRFAADAAAEANSRREANEARQRLAREKAELQRLERNHYGKVITY